MLRWCVKMVVMGMGFAMRGGVSATLGRLAIAASTNPMAPSSPAQASAPVQTTDSALREFAFAPQVSLELTALLLLSVRILFARGEVFVASGSVTAHKDSLGKAARRDQSVKKDVKSMANALKDSATAMPGSTVLPARSKKCALKTAMITGYASTESAFARHCLPAPPAARQLNVRLIAQGMACVRMGIVCVMRGTTERLARREFAKKVARIMEYVLLLGSANANSGLPVRVARQQPARMIVPASVNALIGNASASLVNVGSTAR